MSSVPGWPNQEPSQIKASAGLARSLMAHSTLIPLAKGLALIAAAAAAAAAVVSATEKCN